MNAKVSELEAKVSKDAENYEISSKAFIKRIEVLEEEVIQVEDKLKKVIVLNDGKA